MSQNETFQEYWERKEKAFKEFEEGKTSSKEPSEEKEIVIFDTKTVLTFIAGIVVASIFS
jgi:hypothetical protein